jgi:hypothetical protein
MHEARKGSSLLFACSAGANYGDSLRFDPIQKTYESPALPLSYSATGMKTSKRRRTGQAAPGPRRSVDAWRPARTVTDRPGRG